ncbi:MAG TPA: hypothetical protein VGK95_02860, partial [Caldimonas sp.]
MVLEEKDAIADAFDEKVKHVVGADPEQVEAASRATQQDERPVALEHAAAASQRRQLAAVDVDLDEADVRIVADSIVEPTALHPKRVPHRDARARAQSAQRGMRRIDEEFLRPALFIERDLGDIDGRELLAQPRRLVRHRLESTVAPARRQAHDLLQVGTEMAADVDAVRVRTDRFAHDTVDALVFPEDFGELGMRAT